ncbi:MAG: RusA family crossover junction endodeoxyribonuclease [Dehalococcoidales bacterium]|nr:RusA family crossover junction endodeoxyribonuclease [Dehalococcoidales bacterium]
MKLTIDYPPIPRGMPRVMFFNGKARTYYSKTTTKALEDIRTLIAGMNLEPFEPHTPIKLAVTFFRVKSKWAKGKQRKETMPVRKADLDNYIKLLLDCLSPLIVPDDAQITNIEARKRFAPDSHGFIEVELSEDKIDA